MNDVLQGMIAFLGAHPYLAILASFLVSFGEALLLLGLFVPSTITLGGAGTLIGMGKLAFWPIFLASVLGAVAGDALAFWIGVRFKDRIRTMWPFARYPGLMAKGERFFERHGAKSIFIVRFIPGVKAVVPTIAGMLGMPGWRFTVINVASAFVWSAVHLLPAVAIGRGIRVTQSTNPRGLGLLVIMLVIVALTWVITKLALRYLMPLADRARLWAGGKLARQGAWAQVLARLLNNQDGILATVSLAVLAILALSGFGLLLSHVLFDPQLALSDTAISAFVQGVRTEWATQGMVALTMLGDGWVLLPIAGLLIAALLLWRQWPEAGSVALAVLAGAAFVPLVKSALHRARPIRLHEGADAFSFPSGHSTQATVIFGLLALMVARSVPERFRTTVYMTTAMLVALVAFSRVYLMAHWPSDVAAGLLFGTSVVFVIAMILHKRPMALPGWALGGVVAVGLLAIYPAHLVTGFSPALAQYDVRVPETVLTHDDWVRDGWRQLPTARILLDGDVGEPMVLQSDLAVADVVVALAATGWTPVPANRVSDLMAAVMPSRGGLMEHAPWPETHSGRPPLAVLVRLDPDQPGSRQVLRIWPTGFQARRGDAQVPILMASATSDRLELLGFGYALLDDAELTATQTRRLRGDIALALPAAVSTGADTPLLATKTPS